MIKIENLTKKINDKIIFNNLNLEIPSKTITFIIGKSGIGKTTLINLIAGFMKKDSGEISFFAENGTKIKDPLIDVVFQNFNLIESLSIKNNILIANHILNRQSDDSRIEKTANFIDIETQKLDQLVKNLSGGEKQRAAFLRSLSRDSSFILLDEPTGNLDHENSIALLDLLTKTCSDKTILIVSHNLELAKKYAHQIINLEDLSVEVIKNKDQIEIISKNTNLNQVANYVYKKPGFLQKFRVALLLTLADFRSKMVSFFMVLLTFFALIFSIVIFVNLNISAKNIVLDKVTQLNLDTILLGEKDISALPLEEIEQLKKDNPKIKYIIPRYAESKGFKFLYNDKIALENHIFQIDESDFFKKRYSLFSNDKNFGNRFIKNPNEVIISKKLVKELGIDNPIGKIIKIINIDIPSNDIKSLDDFSETATIVGTLDKPFEDGVDFSIVHTNKIKSIYEKFYKTLIKTQENNGFKEYEFLPNNYYSLDFEKYITSRGTTAAIIPDNQQIQKSFYENLPEAKSINLSQGRLPEKFNEIAVSSNVTSEIGKLLKIRNNINSLIFKVVGIFDSKNNDENTIIFHHNVEKYSKELLPRSFMVYLDQNNLYNNIQEFLTKYNKLGVNRYYNVTGSPDEIMNQLISSRYTLLLVIFVSIVIFGISLLIFVSAYAANLSNFKKKSIGILKSLGGKTSQIFLYHWLNLVIISVFVFVIGIIFSVSLVPVVYQAISQQNWIFPDYSQISIIFIIVWLASFFVLSIIYLLISHRIYKKDIVTLLK
ncbi:ATP-binding cassette domain-containing protein [Mycoplasma sp. 'Moose RK']|uniref:ABC transporter ATP-binding protein/permease n=1 Tax=Mycoplasma sp. 'Moose RK' TaxID=2780095 RepID=UPI0018C30F33|nr:ATP-binding cassette domain-containing protein [Mycoplasma sp. 'Moose RK']MBG0730768.1 ATP-binding cassette domain-containing protein [Mycoplasma sp. 'Moose RK']